jgi:hypothetical protein
MQAREVKLLQLRLQNDWNRQENASTQRCNAASWWRLKTLAR